MQVSEPINESIDDAYSGVCNSRGFDPVGEILKGFGKAEIDPTKAKHQREGQAPETDRTVQMPNQALPTHSARQSQAAPPRHDARPPDHETSDCKHQQGERASAVHFPASCAAEQIVVQLEQP